MYNEQKNKRSFSWVRGLIDIELALSFFLSFSLFLSGCTGATVTTGAFRQVDRLESELRRGVSTKMEVQRMLGVPIGLGSSILPTDPRPREVWYYGGTEVIGTQFEFDGTIRANQRQQILLVFFDQGVFDGYMWFSNEGTSMSK